MTKEAGKEPLVASEGKILTDGVNFSKRIFLSCNSNPEDYYEIPEEEYEEILAEQEREGDHE